MRTMAEVNYDLSAMDLSNHSVRILIKMLSGFLYSKLNYPEESTLVVFEVLKRVAQNIQRKSYYSYHLHILMNFIEDLRKKNDFSVSRFKELIDSHNAILPLPLLYRLHHSSYYSYETYIVKTNVYELNQLFTSFMKSSLNKIYIFDFIFTIYRSTFIYAGIPRPSLNNNNYQAKADYLSNQFMRRLLFDFVNNPESDAMRDFLQYCEIYSRQEKYFEGIYTILKYLITYDGEKVSMRDAYIMQALWTNERCPEISATMRKLVNLNPLQNITELFYVTINEQIHWKYFLIFVTEYAANVQGGPDIVNAAIKHRFSGTLLGDFNLDNFVVPMLMARHVCFRQLEGFKNYRHWYRRMFGSKRCFFAGNPLRQFTLLTQYLQQMIEFEPKYAITVHCTQDLTVPRGLRPTARQFKDLCTREMALYRADATIDLEGLNFRLTSLLVHAVRSTEIILALRYPAGRAQLLPYFVRDKIKYGRILQSLITATLINIKDIHPQPLNEDSADSE